MKELFGKKRKSEIDELNDHTRPRFYSTCCDINFEFDSDLNQFNQPFFFDDNDANNNHSDFSFNTLDYDKFNIA